MENYIEYIKNQVEEHIRNVPIEVNTAIGDDEGNNYKYKERNEKIFDDFLENQDFEIEKDIKKEKIKLCFLIDKIANKYNLGNIGKNSRRQIIETLFIPDENGNILCFDCSNCIDCYKCVNCNKCEQCSLCINSNNMFDCKCLIGCNEGVGNNYCINCIKCDQCDKCEDCKDCSELGTCVKCNECVRIYDCIDCFKCINDCCNCKGCRYCSDCVNCNDCFECINCKNCQDCKNCKNCYKCRESSNLCSGIEWYRSFIDCLKVDKMTWLHIYGAESWKEDEEERLDVRYGEDKLIPSERDCKGKYCELCNNKLKRQKIIMKIRRRLKNGEM